MKGNGQNVGYRRVSSYDQNQERQLEGMTFDAEYEEKASAKDVNRPVLMECLKYIRKGDTLHIHSIDRLARNLQDLLKLVKLINDNGASVRFHKEALTFTGDDNPMQKLMLQMIGAVAEFERALIKERQREGIANAKKKGTRFGPQQKLSPEQLAEIRQRNEQGETKKDLAKEYGISRQTLYVSLSKG